MDAEEEEEPRQNKAAAATPEISAADATVSARVVDESRRSLCLGQTEALVPSLAAASLRMPGEYMCT